MNKLTAFSQRAGALYKAHLWQGRLLLATLATLLVLIVVRVSLPYTIAYSTIYWLGKQGVTAHIEDISIDITKSTFALLDARGSKNGQRVFEVGQILIDWNWRPLAEKKNDNKLHA